MPETMTLKEQLDAAGTCADELVVQMREPGVDEAQFTELVREYVRCKYFLTADEFVTDDILTLARISIEKLLSINDRSVKLAENSITCTDQSSTDIKKVLLTLTLMRALDVKLTPEENADAETVAQFAHALYARMGEQG